MKNVLSYRLVNYTEGERLEPSVATHVLKLRTLKNIYINLLKLVSLTHFENIFCQGGVDQIGRFRGVGRVANSLYWNILPNKIPLLSF